MTQKTPEQCHSMAELRVEIDQLDRQLIELIAKRTQYIDRAAVLKQSEKLPARITSRVEEVVDNVKRLASQNNLDPQIAETVWRDLIEWSIAKEEQVLGK
ncbi:MAG: chorismate mutase [Rhizobiaceae bacterium]|nr:chorismate mutase [Rhizobiaceae bacterium]